jgi:hypothetical protein
MENVAKSNTLNIVCMTQASILKQSHLKFNFCYEHVPYHFSCRKYLELSCKVCGIIAKES